MVPDFYFWRKVFGNALGVNAWQVQKPLWHISLMLELEHIAWNWKQMLSRKLCFA